MPAPKETPWIKTYEQPFMLLCERCGSKEVLMLPLPVSTVVAKRVRVFVGFHSECKERAED